MENTVPGRHYFKLLTDMMNTLHMRSLFKVTMTRLRYTALTIGIIVLILTFPAFAEKGNNSGYEPTVTGISLNTGYTYDPSDNTFFSQFSYFKIFDYDKIWPHSAPENLRFKVEAAFGGAYLDNNDVRIVANVGMLAMLYIERFATQNIRPYVEGGVGIIYTDYRDPGQAYRFNFNPQMGVGLEFNTRNKAVRFATLRAHHLSNSGISSDNRGQNSVVIMFGQYF